MTASRMVFEGMVPVLMQTPPTTERDSTTATRFFIFDAATAARWPEGPDPMTIRSYLTALMRVSLPGFESTQGPAGIWRRSTTGRLSRRGVRGCADSEAFIKNAAGMKPAAWGGNFGRRRPGLTSAGIETMLLVRLTESRLVRGLSFAVEHAASLLFVFEAELANHAVEVAGQRGETLQSLDSFFRALSGFRGQLRDLAGGLGNFSRGRGLLGGGGGDELDLVLDLLGGLDDGFEAVAGVGGFSHSGFDRGAAFMHHFESLAGSILDAADGSGDFFSCALGPLGEAANLAGDDGESAAMFAGASRFNGRVQSQQVGLLADLLNHE